MTAIVLQQEVEAGIRRHSPIVVLESAVLTTGLPDRPWAADWDRDALAHAVPDWDPDAPLATQLQHRMEQVVREHGAIPCTTALVDGRLHLGLDERSAKTLMTHGAGRKVASTTLAIGMGSSISAGTTVSAALTACRLLRKHADEPHWTPVLATGGIGGVHRGWSERPDISADLLSLGTTRACVVSAGSKSILDMTATLELLESISVPVLGWRTDRWPSFTSSTPPSNPSINLIEDLQHLGRICAHHWQDLDQASAVLLANPLDDELALDHEAMEHLVEQAEQLATDRGLVAADRTPFVLSTIADETNGRSVAANLALLLGNAKRAAEAACMLVGPHLVGEDG
ncbi:MAG: pseudouridine-5'-phosphate glycosidase [Phycisphaerales bacterium]|nr:pseudouridine-5'-phosphate glycosidase [Phycisphaerales bacterium]